MKAVHLAVAAPLAATSLFGATTASAELKLATRFANAVSESAESIGHLFGKGDDKDPSGLPSMNDTFHLYQQAGDWFIFKNAANGSCLAEKFDANQNAVQFGRAAGTNDAFLAVYAQLPEDFRTGAQRTTVTVGDLSKTGKLDRKQRAGGQSYTGSYVKAPSFDFLAQAPYATSTVKMFWGKELETVISLDGSSQALQATMACEASADGVAPVTGQGA
ncbi:MAG: hypothetical protein CML66_11400 [Rhodobacteraceae bacterium]|nr:hypothetical protein [Paracoccaceae bacterium]MAY45686.1 hypothetical protein [Paracoccaceae bacterium]